MDPVRLASELVRAKSLPGEEREAAEVALDALKEVGVDRAWIGPLGCVLARLTGGSAGTILLTGHLDTVDAGDLSQWDYPPFEGRVVGEWLVGRGSVDMKSGVAAIIASLEHVKETDYDIVVVLTTHEETAEGVAIRRGLREVIGRGLPGAALVAEPSSLNLMLGHRGRAVVEAVIRGASAHASMPWEGRNALEGAATLINLITKLSPGFPSMEGLGRETAVATRIDCSPKITPQIPDTCRVIVDARPLPGTGPDDLIFRLDPACGPIRAAGMGCGLRVAEEDLRFYTGEVVRARYFFPGWVNNYGPLVRAAHRAARAVNPSAETGYWRFSTDATYVAGVAQVPTVGFGPGDPSMAHKPNERVRVREVRAAVEGIVAIVHALGKFLTQMKGTRPM